MIRLFPLFVAVAAPAGALAAAPQDNLRDYGRPIDTPDNRADMALRGAARCVMGEVPTSARRILATPIASDEEAKRIKALPGVARSCFQLQWPEFPPTAFRNALAEASYRERYFVNDPAPANGVPPPASFAVSEAGKAGTPAQEVAWQLAAIAKCTVFAGPEDARQFILGPRNVDEEQRRFTVLQASIRKCVPANDVAELTARNFRGFVAYALAERAASVKK